MFKLITDSITYDINLNTTDDGYVDIQINGKTIFKSSYIDPTIITEAIVSVIKDSKVYKLEYVEDGNSTVIAKSLSKRAICRVIGIFYNIASEFIEEVEEIKDNQDEIQQEDTVEEDKTKETKEVL